MYLLKILRLSTFERKKKTQAQCVISYDRLHLAHRYKSADHQYLMRVISHNQMSGSILYKISKHKEKLNQMTIGTLQN